MATVRVSSRGGFRQEIEAGRHVLQADEPHELGGTDTGPDPYSLLLASLGACTSMTVRLYARRKGWPLEGVEVELSHRRVYLDDCKECSVLPDDKGHINVVRRQLRFRGPLSSEQRKRLVEIAARCPVHKTLAHGIHIDDEVEEP